MDPVIGALIGTAGLGAVGGVTNLIGQGNAARVAQEQLDYNKWAQQVAWSREDNAVQRRVSDLRAAGLSPTLAAGSAASSMAPISVGQRSPIDPGAAVAAALQPIMAASQLAQTKAQVGLINEQTRATEFNMLTQDFHNKIAQAFFPEEFRAKVLGNKVTSMMPDKIAVDTALTAAQASISGKQAKDFQENDQRPGSFWSDFGNAYKKVTEDIGAKGGFLGDAGKMPSKKVTGAGQIYGGP